MRDATLAWAAVTTAAPASVPRRNSRFEGGRAIPFWARIAIPLGIAVAILVVWEFAVDYYNVSHVVLPAPSLIYQSYLTDGVSLLGSLVQTAKVTYLGFFCALVAGVIIAIGFARSQVIEVALSPFAVMLQVTPMIAIAPLVVIWVGINNTSLAVLILASIVAFFPILSNTTLGLKSADHNLRELMHLSRASSWQRLIKLELPSAMPYLLGGMKISIGLALIGSVVAEFVAGSGASMGLAWRIIEAANRLNAARMFAALSMLSAFGILNFLVLTRIQHALLHRWHESAVRISR